MASANPKGQKEQVVSYLSSGKVMLLGGMNTRTATWGDFITYGILNSAILNDVAVLLTYGADVVLHVRKNPDVAVNDFG